jgi:hypothetical protein
VEQRRHWWNGKWGKLARRDIYLRTDADVWWVVVRALLARDEDWREIGVPPEG